MVDKGVKVMSDTMWLYNPKFCDGQTCSTVCDGCPVAEQIFEDEEDEQDRKLNAWLKMIGGDDS